MKSNDHERQIANLADRVACTYRQDGVINRIGGKDLPSQATIVRILDRLLVLVFPGYHGQAITQDTDMREFAAGHLEQLHVDLTRVLGQSLRFSRRREFSCAGLLPNGADGDLPSDDKIEPLAEQLALEYLAFLPAIREDLRTDVQAAYDGDPAACSTDEVILCYPGVMAIAVHRLAHPLQGMGVPLVPRIMSEWAHHRTGVDIHPGATIGRHFFVDHGTGTVIGETTIIGEHVKLYQGVTLGALSFARNTDGSLVKGGKRHPTVEDEVTVYAGATILGGETVIGRGAVIGGSAWITAPVPPGTKVLGGRSSVTVADER